MTTATHRRPNARRRAKRHHRDQGPGPAPLRRLRRRERESPASIDYQETSELVVLTHTEVDPSFEGRGVGSALARAALDDVRERQLKALVICPFILSWLRRHPEYVDVLFNAPPSKVGNEVPT